MSKNKKILYAAGTPGAGLKPTDGLPPLAALEDIGMTRDLPLVDVVDIRDEKKPPADPQTPETPKTPEKEPATWTILGITWPRRRWVLAIGGTAAVLTVLAVLAFKKR